MNLRSRSSSRPGRARALPAGFVDEHRRVPIEPDVGAITAALLLRALHTITAFTSIALFTVPSGVASFTDAVTMSPRQVAPGPPVIDHRDLPGAGVRNVQKINRI